MGQPLAGRDTLEDPKMDPIDSAEQLAALECLCVLFEEARDLPMREVASSRDGGTPIPNGWTLPTAAGPSCVRKSTPRWRDYSKAASTSQTNGSAEALSIDHHRRSKEFWVRCGSP